MRSTLALVLFLACSGGRVAAHEKAESSLSPAAAPPATVAAAPFSVELATPYFTTGKAAEATAQLALRSFAKARDLFAQALASPNEARDDAARARLAFLLALCDLELGRFAEAAARFDQAASALPLLADYARYHAARAYYWSGDLDRALARARQVAPDAVLYAEAQLLVGDVLRRQGDPRAIAAHYAKYLAEHPGGIRVAEARFRLAEAYEKAGRAVPEALELYRKITIEHPLESWSEAARARLEALLSRLPKRQRKKVATLTAAEHLARADVYFDHMRNPESEMEYRRALAAPGLTPDLECQIRYRLAQSVFKQRQRARSAPLFDEAIDACARTQNTDLQTRAAYQAGRGWFNHGDHERAIERFVRAETWNPGHSFNDDARLRQAEVWADLAEAKPERAAEARARVTELLSTLPEVHPDGDMKAEALWRLAWRDYKEGRYEDAIRWLDRQIATVPHDDNYWAEGQAQYWKGRALEKLGRRAEAMAVWEAGIRQYPLSYYSLLALNRVRERSPREFSRLVAELRRPPRDWRPGAPELRFAPRPVFGTPGFARAVELLRLGLGAEAERELARLGLRPPPGRSAVTDPDRAEELWATALLYDRAGRHDKSHWIARWSVLDYKRAWPTEANALRWRIAYPRAWWHLLEPAAKAQGYPPELLVAFVREESAFDPILESFANAIGLTQMILPTARRFGKDLGFPITRENLRDPEKNVAIGSRFLAFLWRTFEERVALVVPAYNAGEGAVWRWLCERAAWDQDEFAEEIPYDETRNYSKRVLASYFAYAFLESGEVPSLPNDIPPSVVNAKRCPGGAPSQERPGKTYK